MLALNGMGPLTDFLNEPLIDLMECIAANNAAIAKRDAEGGE